VRRGLNLNPCRRIGLGLIWGRVGMGEKILELLWYHIVSTHLRNQERNWRESRGLSSGGRTRIDKFSITR
jgi:hypothetical protein